MARRSRANRFDKLTTRSESPIARQRDHASWAVFGAIAFAYVFFAAREFDFGRDPAVYAGLAKSLVTGAGYWFNSRPHVQYPPGYPVLLAPVAWISDHSFVALSRFTAAWWALAMMLAVRYANAWGATWWKLMLVLLALSAPFFRHATDGLESEGPYLAASLAFLLAARRAAERPSLGWTVVLGSTLIATLATRSIGVAMVLATGCACLSHLARWWWTRRRTEHAVLSSAFRPLATSLVVAVPWLVGWYIWTRTNRLTLYRGEFMDQYDAQFRLLDPHRPDLGRATLMDVIARIPDGIVVQGAHAVELLTNVSWIQPSWFIAPVGLAIVVTALGILRELRGALPLMGWYVLMYLGFLAVWPFDEGVRFLLPILPLLLLLAASGIQWVAHAIVLGERWARAMITLIAAGALAALLMIGPVGERTPQEQVSVVLWIALLAWTWRARRLAPRLPGWLRRSRSWTLAYAGVYGTLGVVAILSTAASRLQRDRPDRNDNIRHVARWISANTSMDDVVMAAASAGLHYGTGRPTVPFPVSADTAALRASLLGMRPDVLVIEDRKEFEYFFPTQGERLGIIRGARLADVTEVARVPGARIFRIQVQPMRDSLTTKSSM